MKVAPVSMFDIIVPNPCIVRALVQRRSRHCVAWRVAAGPDAFPSSLDDAVLPTDACDEPGDVRSPGVSLRQVRTIL